MPQVLQPRSRTLPDLLDEIAVRDPAREFIVGGTERWSYGETRARARQVAKGLLKLGVKRGDRVALLMPNRPEWLLVDFAVTLLGATLVPISTWSRARELAYMLDHSDATTLITVERFAGQGYLGMLADLGGTAASLRTCGTSASASTSHRLTGCGWASLSSGASAAPTRSWP